MDAFIAICQGLGLALAVGLVIGVVVPPIMPAWGVIAGAAPLGILACAAALNGADEAVWPAILIGGLGAALAALVAHDVAAGAARREGQARELETQLREPSAALTAMVIVAAALLALLSLFLPPVSLVALAALAYLYLSRRGREDRKHEGLRVLR
jgi:hypothetical protein